MKKLWPFIFASFLLASSCQGRIEPVKGEEENPAMSTDANPVIPKHWMRAVWIASVRNIDWPKGIYDEQSQKALYIRYLEHFKSLNINAVFLQVRPTADAFYESEYEPWSSYLTGTEGKAAGYDVMRFLIDEAHKRGMQFHAWINPYRIDSRTDESQNFKALDSRIPKEWTKDYRTIRIYNPALPEVRERIAAIVRELIVRYDVDGVHMDDYFYPDLQKGESMNDDAEFLKYGSGFANIADWRRSNVTKMVTTLSNAISDTRPEVIFSISPQGNYDNNYNYMFFDTEEVCRRALIDIIIPQLYWSTTAKTDYFTPRLEWFCNRAYSVPVMVGYGVYRFDGYTDGFKDASELLTELNMADARSNVTGDIFYNAATVLSNPININGAIRTKYSHPALLPEIKKGSKVPSVPSGLTLSGNTLCWNQVEGASNYAIYRSAGDKQTAELIGTVCPGFGNETPSASVELASPGVYFVTALNRFNAESQRSELVLYK